LAAGLRLAGVPGVAVGRLAEGMEDPAREEPAPARQKQRRTG
jgi:hypothetical protein